MWRNLRWKKLGGLFAIFFLLFNYPLLTIFQRNGLIWGIPRTYFALFSLWLLMIVLMAWLVESRK
jgi:hypothetical protein